ncbi:MAG: glucosamine-6-phosphate deaminase, partial [Sphingobacteriales bacterium]
MHKLNLLEETRYEKVPVKIFGNDVEASAAVAQSIARVIKSKHEKGETAVLGLATGVTPIKVYKELIRLHKEEGLSFKNVVTFNLDEYYPIQPDAEQSYVRFMKENLFDHIDIDLANVNIPDGTLKEEQIADFCLAYEQKINSYGGIDLQVLGIGRTGHIGFNEPGSAPNSGTRLVTLNDLTRSDASKDFGGKDNVPTKA